MPVGTSLSLTTTTSISAQELIDASPVEASVYLPRFRFAGVAILNENEDRYGIFSN